MDFQLCIERDMKATVAAAEDAIKVRGRLTGNVWDRLGKQSAEVVDSKEEEEEEEDEGKIEDDRKQQTENV